MQKKKPPQQLQKNILTALKQFHKVEEPADNALSNLILVQITQDQQKNLSRQACINFILEDGINQLGIHQDEGSKILKSRFLDGKSIAQVDQEMAFGSIDRVKHKQSSAIKELALVIWDMEQAARNELIATQKGKLVAKGYTQLFGINERHKKLYGQLTSDGSPWVVTLAGIGGIGKTSLANFTVRRVIEKLHYHDVVWLKIPDNVADQRPYPAPQTFEKLIVQLCQKMLPALSTQTPIADRIVHLQRLLKSQPFLVIIDDLELKEDTAYLLSELVNLANPSRFLLTSRIQPAPQAGSQSIFLPELTKEFSLELIRHYAGEIGFTEAENAEDEELLPIYDLVGGNPFSLKHLVNLALHRPLKSLLGALSERPLEHGNKIYMHILQETWLSLSNDAKTVLAVMTLATDGGMEPDMIAKLTGLSDANLWPAINELIGRSLLEVRSDSMWERSYGIHRLTELFLRSLLNGGNDQNAENKNGNDDL